MKEIIVYPVETAVIKGFANGGEAVGTLESGKTVFVRGAVPGERVEVEVFQDKNRYSRARLLKVLEKSPERIESDCPCFPVCPGCSYRHVPYSMELDWKQRQLEYLLRGIEDVQYHAPVGAASRNAWRNKLTLHVQDNLCGYKKDDNVSLLPVSRCLMAYDNINEEIKNIRTHENCSITLRSTPQNGVIQLERGKESKTVLTETLGKFGDFKVSASGFFQTNLEIAEKLVAQVVKCVRSTGCSKLCELYCGTGVFSIACAENIPTLECTANELVKEAVIRARNNAANHSVSSRCRFFDGDAGKFFARYKPSAEPFVLLVDPPRTGMDAETVKCILKHLPETVIYISCAADTLARDLKRLSEKYTVSDITLFDMFPGTSHFETLAVCRLKH